MLPRSACTATLLAALVACRTPCGTAPPAASPPPDPGAKDANEVMRRSLTLDDVPRHLWQVGREARFAPTTLAERETLPRLVPLLLLGAAAAPTPDIRRWQPD